MGISNETELADSIRTVQSSNCSSVAQLLHEAFSESGLGQKAVLMELIYHIFSRTTYIEYETRNLLTSELDRRLPLMVEAITKVKTDQEREVIQIKELFEKVKELQIFKEQEMGQYISEIKKKIAKIRETRKTNQIKQQIQNIEKIKVNPFQLRFFKENGEDLHWVSVDFRGFGCWEWDGLKIQREIQTSRAIH